MKYNWKASIGAALSLSILSIFNSVVTGSVVDGSSLVENTFDLERELLEKAVPLSDHGEDVVRSVRRRLDGEEDGDGEDDYYVENTYGFKDYSLKYATCQKIQRFSDDGVGRYSPFIVDNIVVLRLCPKRQCSENTQWGCTSGYGEYALSLNTYLKIMLNYKADKREKMCDFCQECGNRRRLDGDDFYAAGDDDQIQVDDGHQYYDKKANDDANEKGNQNDNDDDVYAMNYDDAAKGKQDDYYQYDPCNEYSSICENAGDKCNNQGEFDQYKDYIKCNQIMSNGAIYYTGLHCDQKKNIINVGVFSDSYCANYVGDRVKIDTYDDISFSSIDKVFSQFYSNTCIDCTMNYNGPYENAQNNMCNNIYRKSGQCNTYLAYAIDDENGQEAAELNCAFIESIRYGTYDGKGRFYSNSSQRGGGVPETVSIGQTASLVFLSLVCVGLGIYSCVLHHKITNVLLKSFSMGILNANTSKMRHTPRRRKKSKSTVDSDAFSYQSHQGEIA